MAGGPGHTEPGLSNVLAAYKACLLKHVNPFKVPVIIDIGSSAKYRSYRIGGCPCITKSRAGSFAYWCSTKG